MRFGVRLKQFKQFYVAPRPESSVLTLDWTGCMLDFVEDLVEEHVGLGGSQFSESILERLCSAHASPQR